MATGRKHWLLRDKGEVYALCSLCVMYRRLEFYVDYDATPEQIAEVVASQDGRCRAEIEDYPCCRSVPAAGEGEDEPDPTEEKEG